MRFGSLQVDILARRSSCLNLRIVQKDRISHLPLIFGIQSIQLSEVEIQFFQIYHPVGIILSHWNFEKDREGNINKDRLRILCSDIKSDGPYILIDQEGGEVRYLQGVNIYDPPTPDTFSSNK
jgi:beta-glucosidase-like glycosyl hydrolase